MEKPGSRPHRSAAEPLNKLALSATVHCLTGCAIGEVLGMILATWWGWGDGASIALAVVLAFFFGYGLTSLPLLRSGLPVRRVVPLALASDTASITTHTGSSAGSARSPAAQRSTRSNRTCISARAPKNPIRPSLRV